MADRPRVPDAFFHLAFWLGVMAALVLFGNGRVVRSSDRFRYPEYGACVLIAAGLLGASYETVAVVRAAKVRDGEASSS